MIRQRACSRAARRHPPSSSSTEGPARAAHGRSQRVAEASVGGEWSLRLAPRHRHRNIDITPATANAQPPNPRILRHGFTPRNTSSTAHPARAAMPIQPSVVRAAVSVGTTHRNAAARRKIANGTFGNWATVIRPVCRLRNIQSRTATIAGQYRASSQSETVDAGRQPNARCARVKADPVGCATQTA
jgi:hypothetical protein